MYNLFDVSVPWKSINLYFISFYQSEKGTTDSGNSV